MVAIKPGMLHYVLDHVYGAFMHRTMLSPLFFSRGWGGTQLDLLERMIKQIFPVVGGQNLPPRLIQPIWRTLWETKSACLKEGVFKTPCDEQLINALPPKSHIARVAFLAPKFVPPHKMACVVHLAEMDESVRVRWTNEAIKCFLESCIEEINKVGRNGGSLRKASWLNVAAKIEQVCHIKLTQKQLKNHYDYLKGKYAGWVYLRNRTGNIYDPELNMFKLSPQEWEDFYKVINKYSYFIVFR